MKIILSYDSQQKDLIRDEARAFTGRIVKTAKGDFFIAPYNVEKFEKMPESKYAYYLNRLAQIVAQERPDLVPSRRETILA